MDRQHLLGELRGQLRERPYWTTAALVGVGWILGSSLPAGALLALGGFGARAAMASALEGAVRNQTRPADEEKTGSDPSEGPENAAGEV
jgi:hypothetical protein